MPMIIGESFDNDGVLGVTTADGKSGVAGVNDVTIGAGVMGRCKKNNGVQGFSEATNGAAGVVGVNELGNGPGVEGRSSQNDGVVGFTTGDGKSGVAGVNLSTSPNAGPGVFGKGSRLAGLFEGNVFVQGDVEVTGDIRLINADCAEDFNIGTDVTVEPGTVMVLGEEGALFPSQRAYDKCVAGVVSGAGDYKPGIVLDKQQSETNRQPIALLGKVYCKVDAQYGIIEIGDLLTSSPTLGHAMKAEDQVKAFGSVIGKALRPLKEGQGLIPILIALQ